MTKRRSSLGVLILICIVSTVTSACGGSHSNLPVPPTATPTPTIAIPVQPTYKAVSAGGTHTCALDVNGVAYCWGSNGSGELGDGTTSPSTRPHPVAGGHVFSAISAGYIHTCAIAAGTGPDVGEVYCWGQSYDGELGNGVAASASVTQPTAVSTGVAGVVFTSISAGYLYTCAATGGLPTNANTPAGYCWGADDIGQTGQGSLYGTQRYRPYPVPVEPPAQTVPPLIYSSIVAGGPGNFGGVHTCGLTTTGQAFCWGSNATGALGHGVYGIGANGSGVVSLDPVPVTDTRGNPLAFMQIGVGQDFSCGLTTAQLALCWGINAEGQLGNNTSGSPPFSPVPSAVQGNMTFAAMSVGLDTTCAEQPQPSATLYCWGYNQQGELGNETTSFDSAVPVAVSGNHQFTQFSVVWDHACGVQGGAIFCWGDDSDGQLGNLMIGTGSAVPVQVAPAG